jgi:hypothetical protein
VQQGDLVSWNNTTGDEHWPWLVAGPTAPPGPTPDGGVYLTLTSVKPASASDAYNLGQAPPTKLFYCCKFHPSERACIEVVPPKTSGTSVPTV